MWYFNLWSINLTSRLNCFTMLILDLLWLLLLLYRWFLMFTYRHNFLLEGFLSKRSHESIAFISEFSESLQEMGSCLLKKTALNDDEESGKWMEFYHVFIWWHYLKKLYPFRWFIVFCICFLVHHTQSGLPFVVRIHLISAILVHMSYAVYVEFEPCLWFCSILVFYKSSLKKKKILKQR